MKQIINLIIEYLKGWFITPYNSNKDTFLDNIDCVYDYIESMKELIFNDSNFISNSHTMKDMWFLSNHYRLLILSQISKLSGIDREIANCRLKQFIDDMDVFDNGNITDSITDNYIYNLRRIANAYNVDIISFKELYR